MSSFKRNLQHLDTCMLFKIIADQFQQLPVGHHLYETLGNAHPGAFFKGSFFTGIFVSGDHFSRDFLSGIFFQRTFFGDLFSGIHRDTTKLLSNNRTMLKPIQIFLYLSLSRRHMCTIYIIIRCINFSTVENLTESRIQDP